MIEVRIPTENDTVSRDVMNNKISKDNVMRSQVDGYGFERTENFDQDTYDEFMSSYLSVLARRAVKWQRMIGGKSQISRSRKVKRYCRKGIPNEHRPLTWLCVSGALKKMKNQPNMYESLLRSQLDSTTVEQINTDLHRTFPDNIYFTTSEGLRKPLYNVLVAVSHKNSDKGYCQGLNFIAGVMLLVLKSEEKTFWLMDTVINDILPDYYNPDMKALRAEQELLGEIIKWKAEDIYTHLESLGVSWCLVSTKWFLCLFADVLPVESVLRIWDCFFYEGTKILVRVAAMLIIKNKEDFLRCKSFTDAMDAFKVITSSPKIVHCHSFLQSCFTELGPFPHAKINKMREDCFSNV